MRRNLGALLVLLLVGWLAPQARSQEAAFIPKLTVKQLHWGTWTPQGFVVDTTGNGIRAAQGIDSCNACANRATLNGAKAADTTEAVSTADWSWVGPGLSGTSLSNPGIARLLGVVGSTAWADSVVDSTYAGVDQSWDGINWTTSDLGSYPWTTALKVLALNVKPPAVNMAPWAVVNTQVIATFTSAQMTTSGVQTVAPWVRFRVRKSGDAGAIIGLKLFLCYFSRIGG